MASEAKLRREQKLREMEEKEAQEEQRRWALEQKREEVGSISLCALETWNLLVQNIRRRTLENELLLREHARAEEYEKLRWEKFDNCFNKLLPLCCWKIRSNLNANRRKQLEIKRLENLQRREALRVRRLAQEDLKKRALEQLRWEVYCCREITQAYVMLKSCCDARNSCFSRIKSLDAPWEKTWLHRNTHQRSVQWRKLSGHGAQRHHWIWDKWWIGRKPRSGNWKDRAARRCHRAVRPGGNFTTYDRAGWARSTGDEWTLGNCGHSFAVVFCQRRNIGRVKGKKCFDYSVFVFLCLLRPLPIPFAYLFITLCYLCFLG